MKKLIILCFILIFLFGTFISPFALPNEGKPAGLTAANEGKLPELITDNNDSIETITKYIEAINSQDADTIIALAPNNDEKMWVSYFSDPERKDVGFRNILSAEISILEPVEYDVLFASTDIGDYLEQYGTTVEGYLVGTELSVIKEDRYSHNGLNMHLIITANEGTQKKIIEYSEASLFLLGKIFDENEIKDSEDLQSVFRYKEAKSQGLILNSNGDVIETNRATPEQLKEEMRRKLAVDRN